jgi:2-polyprenyl-3-methyl-5-hydroxy-6-metoxy-1,4-benzoquinol methylase
MPRPENTYNAYARQYAALVAAREAAGIEADPIMPRLLAEIGPVDGLRALDAGCGEGYLARILVARGAQVTGADVAPALIELARARDPAGAISWRVGDLSQPAPDLEGRFDLAASHMVLNDVPDHRGFLRTVAAALKPGGRYVFSMNSPYSYVVRGHIHDYFSQEAMVSYRGMAEAGVKVYFFQRTLEEYIDACLEAGFELRRLLDVPTPEGSFKRRRDTLIPTGYHFPFFMILSLRRAL